MKKTLWAYVSTLRSQPFREANQMTHHVFLETCKILLRVGDRLREGDLPCQAQTYVWKHFKSRKT